MLHLILERCVHQVVNLPGRTEPGTARTRQGPRVGRGLGTLASVVAGSFRWYWSVGMGEPSSRCHPPLEEGFELALERGHSVKGFQHPERSVFYVTGRQHGNCTSFD
jgi:hypothetical protein